MTLSYAQSLDGSLALERGRPLRLSSPPTLRLTHQLRALHDAILVGIGTVLADNPRLTVRLVRGKQPQPVVLDSHLHMPLTAALLENPPRPPWIATVETPQSPRWQALQAHGAMLLSLAPNLHGNVDWADLLSALYRRGICTLMVEGGARVIQSLLEAAAADQVVVTLATRFVGGLSVLEQPLSHFEKLGFPSLEEPGCQRLGDDIVVWGKVCYPPATPG
ncbi:MAG: Diaminohydroxyphosphoribosylaminopyrimidine deaminase [Anaerolineae bacterium]|nr:MAG: Diaminohydroxyphosphoribosylaminopyrimidine deaminase [Anaerolineae bacterium]